LSFQFRYHSEYQYDYNKYNYDYLDYLYHNDTNNNFITFDNHSD